MKKNKEAKSQNVQKNILCKMAIIKFVKDFSRITDIRFVFVDFVQIKYSKYIL